MLTSDPVARGSALLFWAKVAGNAGFFVAVLELARGLGPAGRGTVAFVTVTALIVARVAVLGMGDAATVFAARDSTLRRVLLPTIVASAAAAAAIAAALACLALVLVGDGRPAGVGTAELLVLPAGVLASALVEAGAAFLLGCDRLRPLAFATATVSWVYPLALGAVWISAGLTVARALCAWVAAEATRAVVLLGLSARGVRPGRPSARLALEALRFGSRAWVGSLARFLNFRIDQVLMGFLASEAALGIYAVAVNASEALLYLPAATATALLPVAARAGAGERAEQAVRAFRSAAIVTISAAALAAVAGPALLPVVFGASFADSVEPFLWLLPGALGFAAVVVFSNALLGSSAPGRSSLGPLTSLVVGVALDAVLIPRFGANGAAAAASAAFLAGGAIAVAVFARWSPFAWRDLVSPRRADLDVLRALARPLRAS